MIFDEKIENILLNIRKEKPLIHCITNVITINDCANVISYLGASPTMAHSIYEVEEIVSNASCLLVNLGATENFNEIELACKKATKLDIPIVIDPVGIAASSFRRKFLLNLLEKNKISAIRGNMSELLALAKNENTTIGVDSQSYEETYKSSIETLQKLSKKLDTLLIASGKQDLVCSPDNTSTITGGNFLMSKVSGTGCMSSCILATFIGASNDKYDIHDIAASTCNFVKNCGENAYKKLNSEQGIHQFKINFLDEISLSLRKNLISKN